MNRLNTFTADDKIQIAYQIEGDPTAPALVFSNALGTDLHMWDAQVAALGAYFRIIRYDTRGHGESGVSEAGMGIDRLGNDLRLLLDYLVIEHAHICGLSLGGLTAQWLAIQHPQRVDRLVLANTAARSGSVEVWNTRIAAVTAGGTGAVREAVLARFFRPAFRIEDPETAQFIIHMLDVIDITGYIAACRAVRDADLRAAVARIVAPTLIIASDLDESTPLVLSEELHAAIPGSELFVFRDTAHLSNVTHPMAFSELVRRFLLRE